MENTAYFPEFRHPDFTETENKILGSPTGYEHEVLDVTINN